MTQRPLPLIPSFPILPAFFNPLRALDNGNEDLIPILELHISSREASSDLDSGRGVRIRLAGNAGIALLVDDKAVGELSVDGGGDIVNGNLALDREVLGGVVELDANCGSAGNERLRHSKGGEGENGGEDGELHYRGFGGGRGSGRGFEKCWVGV